MNQMQNQNQNQEMLFDKLKNYGNRDFYPYHMPGHKRQEVGGLPASIAQIDITEIDGFDDLHQPEGILAEIQKRAAELYGAEESFLMVNGSTGGILAAVSAALPMGGKLLMARNCHKSAYHAAYLRQLEVVFVYPETDEVLGMCEAVTAEEIEINLDREPDIRAVLIVSPTYEGKIADVTAIAETVHRRGIPLIVDEAHGAHLGLAEGFVQNSCQAGADLVIHSVHKTLPAMTQTALLHVNGSLVDREKLRRFLKIYQTSSPSYVLMASIDNALRIVENEGAERFLRFRLQYEEMLEELRKCHYLCFSPLSRMQDVGKLVISGQRAGVSGQYIYDVFRQRYHLQLEMAALTYCLAMFTISDTKDAFERMIRACKELDRELEEKNGNPQDRGRTGKMQMPDAGKLWVSDRNAIGNTESDIPFYRAWDADTEQIPLEDAKGRYAGEFINLYPPGIPYVIPGEIITQDHCQKTREYLLAGLRVQGVYKTAESSDKIYVKVLRLEGAGKR